MLIAALTALVFVLALLSAWLYVSRMATVDRASRLWRIAMDYIAEEECEMPHEFAACFIAGNRGAIARKFPGFKTFVERRLAEWNAE